jgi:hypothetical protein
VILVDNRRAPRVPVSMLVTPVDEQPVAIGFGYAHNVSEQGLAIDAEAMAEPVRIPPVGTELRMRFKLPRGSVVITAIGRVVRVEERGKAPRMAVQFVDLPFEFRSEIRAYVEATLRS